LTVSYQGSSDSVAITVIPRVVGLAIAGSLYVDLVASDVSTDPNTWPNRTAAAGDDFTAVGTPTYVANVGGTGVAGVEFIRSEADAYLGPITTADLDGGSDRSIEVWAYNPRAADDETLVAWGHRGSTRQNMAVTCGSNLGYGAAGLWADDLGWTTGMPAVGQWHHFVFTYDGATTAKVYADGFLKTTRTLGAVLDTFFDQPIRLGAQGNTAGDDFDFGQALSGYIAAVRVHTGLLSDNDVKNNFLFGIEGTLPGNLTGQPDPERSDALWSGHQGQVHGEGDLREPELPAGHRFLDLRVQRRHGGDRGRRHGCVHGSEGGIGVHHGDVQRCAGVPNRHRGECSAD
jgi:hypothetical protein